MTTYCGADCTVCSFRKTCRGCRATCGSPFGGRCVAAEYIKTGGIEAYRSFKERLTEEINVLLGMLSLPAPQGLTELAGAAVNLAYPLPGGERVKLLDDKDIYLGTQIACADTGEMIGVIADTTFILISRFGADGSDPEILLLRKR